MLFRQRVRRFFVGYARQDYLHLNAALCRVFEGDFKLVVEDKIRRHYVHIAYRAVEYVDVDVLADPFAVKRRVAVWHYKAVGGVCGVEQLALVPGGLRLGHIPHLQKHQRKALHSLAFEHYRGVLPVPETVDAVYVFVCEVYAAVECDLAVDDEYLSVVTVVV